MLLTGWLLEHVDDADGTLPGAAGQGFAWLVCSAMQLRTEWHQAVTQQQLWQVHAQCAPIVLFHNKLT